MIRDLHLIGKQFGRLTILNLYRNNNRTFAECICTCGNSKNINFHAIKIEHTTSCGCYNKEVITKHSLYGTKEYRSWQHMLRRCDTPNTDSSHLYFEKGIRVCERWKIFLNFLEDMGNAPTVTHSIDRLDNNKGYYKENCRWATKIEQSRNTNRNKLIEYNGEVKCMSEWAETFNIKYGVVVKRFQMGWCAVKVFTTPISVSHQRFK